MARRSGRMPGHEAGVSTGEKRTRFSGCRADFALAHPDLECINRHTPSFPDYALTTRRTEGVVGKPGGCRQHRGERSGGLISTSSPVWVRSSGWLAVLGGAPVGVGLRACSCCSSACRPRSRGHPRMQANEGYFIGTPERSQLSCGQEGIDECVERFRAALRRELKKPELVLVKSGAQPHPQVRSDRAGPDKSGHRRGATSQRVRAPPQAPAPSGLRCGDPLAEGLQPSRARDGDDVGRGPCRHRRQSSRGDNPEVRCLSGPY